MSVKQTMISMTMIAAIAISAPAVAGDESASLNTLAANDATANSISTLFISGHSLTDQPFPDYLQQIAAADGTALRWKMHHLPGSSILQRLNDRKDIFAEPDPKARKLARGQDRDAVLASDRHSYDIMVITEQHRVLDSLIWQRSVRSLKEYHDRFIVANPTGKTYFYAPWIGLSDRADPLSWVAYEKRALPVWQCIVTEVNRKLGAEKRADRIEFIPASVALAALVEHLTADADAAGFEKLDAAGKIDALFVDGVHLKPLGAYYVAAITYSTIYSENLPALSPSSLKPGQAEAVRQFATAFMKTYRLAPVPSERECSSGISLALASYYTGYTERTIHRQEMGAWAARVKRIRDTLRLAWRFRNGLE